MFNKMNVKNGIKDLKRYPQISRRVRDTLARLFDLYDLVGSAIHPCTAVPGTMIAMENGAARRPMAHAMCLLPAGVPAGHAEAESHP